jgi:hypothetical protein
MVTGPAAESYDLVADVPIDEVRVTPEGFVMVGRGSGMDRSGYRLEMHLDWKVDRRTMKVLSEILAQSEVRVMRWRSPPRRGQST